MLFDLRVHPEHRRGGTALRLLKRAAHEALLHADLAYSWVVRENPASHGLGRFLGARAVGAFQLQVYPTHKKLRPKGRPNAVPLQALNDLLDASSWDFAPVSRHGDGLVEAFRLEREGQVACCSVWSLENVLGEVVEGLPRPPRVVSARPTTLAGVSPAGASNSGTR